MPISSLFADTLPFVRAASVSTLILCPLFQTGCSDNSSNGPHDSEDSGSGASTASGNHLGGHGGGGNLAGNGGGHLGRGGQGGAPTSDTGGASSGNGVSVEPGISGQVPGLVAVGYAGLRVVSRDGGLSWGDSTQFAITGGDDKNLLRAVTWGNGLWIATGWKLVTSTDGIEWTDHGLISELGNISCNIIEGLAYHDGYYFAACTPWNSPGAVFRSTDGLSWEKYGEIGATEGHLFLTYRGDKFTAYGDSMTSFESTNGLDWTEMPGISEVTYCDGTYKSKSDCFEASWFDGAYLASVWKGKIRRSESGTDFQDVYIDANENGLYRSRAIAAGYVAP